MFEFAYPYMILLLPLPFLVRHLFDASTTRDDAAFFPFFKEIMKLPKGGALFSQSSNSDVRYLALWLAWSLLIVASMRPQKMDEGNHLSIMARDVMLAVDISGSMRVADLYAGRGRAFSRIEVVKELAADFIEQRKGDRVGLVLYSTRAYLQAPQTTDLQTVGELMREAEIGLAGEETAIGDAIGLVIKYLKNQPSKEKVAILLSDGKSNAGNLSPTEVVSIARDEKIKFYTVGVGSDAATGGFLSNNALDEETLKMIAEETGGQYFRARDVNDMQKIYTIIDALEPTQDSKRKNLVLVWEYFYIPLFLSLLIFSLLLAGKSVRLFYMQYNHKWRKK